jgi:hypothetical protein
MELERDGARPNLHGRNIARFRLRDPTSTRNPMRHEFLGHLKANALVSPGVHGDAFIIYSKFLKGMGIISLNMTVSII